MELKIYVNKDVLKNEGNESTLYCDVCKTKLRAGPGWILFCPRCKVIESTETEINEVMSCVHCEKALTIKLNYDGRITGRCENELCGDCWSMQDLCLIPSLVFSIESEKDPYMLRIEMIKEAERMANEYVDVSTLKYNSLQQELFEHLSKANGHLVKTASGSKLVNKALINAVESEHSRLLGINTMAKKEWHSISRMVREHNVKKEEIVAAADQFAKEVCQYELNHCVKPYGKTKLFHSYMYRWMVNHLTENKVIKNHN